MTSYFDLKDYFAEKKYKLVIASDAEPFVHKKHEDKIVTEVPAGGVSVALEPVARAAGATFIARGRTEEDKAMTDNKGYMEVQSGTDAYTLRRLFFTPEQIENYYFGYANQTLWPACHIAFEQPNFDPLWWRGYLDVNRTFAKAIEEEAKEETLIWINDYQLAMTPGFIKPSPKRVIALFWHIPWPTWEIFRILPHKRQLLESMLAADFIGFHRKYQADNFIDTVTNELEVRVDYERNTIFHKDHQTTIHSLPMGIDNDVITSLAEPEDTVFLTAFVRSILGIAPSEKPLEEIFSKNKVILGVDRLDYTKGLPHRLKALWRFYEKYPEFRSKVTYVGFAASSRDQIPSYKLLRKEVEGLAQTINQIYGTKDWQPIHLYPGIFSRRELIELYKHAALMLVTPLDDGMNLVSKEYSIAASLSNDPGMLVLSQFAGSAKDLSQALIVNPYDTESLADAMYTGLKMPSKERKDRIQAMANILHEHNVYEWAMRFAKEVENTARENRKISFG